MSNQYPDPCPETGRRVVTVAEWNNRPDELIDEYAYWFNPEAADVGLDPWRLIEGIDAHTNGQLPHRDRRATDLRSPPALRGPQMRRFFVRFLIALAVGGGSLAAVGLLIHHDQIEARQCGK